MRNKFVSLASAAACCALLVSCGGDDDTTATPTPTPTSTSTPTPTPTAADFDFTKAFTSSATNTSYIFAYFAPTGGTEVWSEGTRRNGEAVIDFEVSPESAEFTWPDATALTTFSAADLLTASPMLRTYRKGDDALAMELPFTHIMRVSYETKVPFVRNAESGTLRSLRYALFFNGVTTTDDITSDLSYTGTAQVAGGLSGTTAADVFSSPSATFTVASSDKALAGTIRIVEDVSGSPVERAALPIAATVGSTNTFSGTIDDTTNGFTGTFVGSLAGPSREEIFIIYNVGHTDGREFIGSYIGG
ncbi:MAG: hypothetical protein R3E14_04605 [Erythrobacter sp.]